MKLDKITVILMFMFMYNFSPYVSSKKKLKRSWGLGSWLFTPAISSRKDKCKCECDDEVKLLALEKVVKVPKIKIHNFGKKEDWEMTGKMDNYDVTNKYKGTRHVMYTKTTPHESGWQVAGKYDLENTKWDFNGQPGLGGVSFS